MSSRRPVTRLELIVYEGCFSPERVGNPRRASALRMFRFLFKVCLSVPVFAARVPVHS